MADGKAGSLSALPTLGGEISGERPDYDGAGCGAPGRARFLQLSVRTRSQTKRNNLLLPRRPGLTLPLHLPSFIRPLKHLQGAQSCLSPVK